MLSEQDKKCRGRPKKRSMAGTGVMANPGRPLKTDISKVSYSTINRRAHDMAVKYDIRTLELALAIKKRKDNYVEPIDNTNSSPVPHSLESAFALFMENDFSKLTMGSISRRL